MMLKTHRTLRKIAMAVAAFPLLQATCDPTASILQLAAGISTIVATSVTNLVVQQTINTLVNTFPGSRILQTLFLNAGFFPRL